MDSCQMFGLLKKYRTYILRWVYSRMVGMILLKCGFRGVGGFGGYVSGSMLLYRIVVEATPWTEKLEYHYHRRVCLRDISDLDMSYCKELKAM